MLTFAVGGLVALACGPAATVVPSPTIDPSEPYSAAIVVGNSPMPAVAGGGAIWVANAGDGTVSRIDPVQARVVATITVGDRQEFTRRDECTGGVHIPRSTSFTVRACDVPSSIAFGAGALWAAKNESNELVRIDPATNRVTDTIAIGAKAWAVAATDQAVWVTDWDNDALIHVDPTTRRVVGRVEDLSHGPSEMSLTPDAFWVLNHRSGTLTRHDLRSGAPVKVIEIGPDPESVTPIGAEVWVRTFLGDVIRIDAGTNEVRGTFHMTDGQGRPGVDHLAVTAAGVWVPGVKTQLVDPVSLQVLKSLDVASYGATVGPDGVVWLLDVAGRVLKLKS